MFKMSQQGGINVARARNPNKVNQDKVTMYIYKTLLRHLRMTHAEYCIGDSEHKMTYTEFVNEVLERGLSAFIISRQVKNGFDVP